MQRKNQQTNQIKCNKNMTLLKKFEKEYVATNPKKNYKERTLWKKKDQKRSQQILRRASLRKN